MERGKVDLNICEKGDILISVHGTVLSYVEKLPEDSYLQHSVKYELYPDGTKYPKNSLGTRDHDGHTFKRKRLETDEDIVLILKKNVLKKLLK